MFKIRNRPKFDNLRAIISFQYYNTLEGIIITTVWRPIECFFQGNKKLLENLTYAYNFSSIILSHNLWWELVTCIQLDVLPKIITGPNINKYWSVITYIFTLTTERWYAWCPTFWLCVGNTIWVEANKNFQPNKVCLHNEWVWTAVSKYTWLHSKQIIKIK